MFLHSYAQSTHKFPIGNSPPQTTRGISNRSFKSHTNLYILSNSKCSFVAGAAKRIPSSRPQSSPEHDLGSPASSSPPTKVSTHKEHIVKTSSLFLFNCVYVIFVQCTTLLLRLPDLCSCCFH